ncbi:MAG: hypothetical protein H6Q15_1376 [Bacteroidetes bacterium]|nr:hypothetical protein [Bacteroidota bacterium]
MDRIKIYISIFILLSQLNSFSQNGNSYICVKESSTFNFFFQINSSTINNNYWTNSHTVKSLNDFLLGVKAKDIDSIKVFSNSSPDGNQNFNIKLSQERAQSIKHYFDIKYSHIPQVKLISQSNGENWNLLRELIIQDTNIPSKQAVLYIIDKVKNLDQREKQLKRLNKGKPYRYILRNIFPFLRNSSTTIIYHKKKINIIKPSQREEKKVLPQTEFIEPKIIIEPVEQGKTQDSIVEKDEPKPEDSDISSKPIVLRERFQLGLKTNLLYYLALAPNIEIEIPIKRFSINAEYQFPWYVNNKKHFAYQILSGSIETRYWLKKQERILSGYFIGAYIGRGIFDLQFSEEGTQGDILFSTGVSGGYSKPISKNFNIEFSLSLGYFKSNNINYYAYEDLLIKKSSSLLTYFGPTKAKVSLVWIINNNN